MEKEKKAKLINVSLWALLGIVILFVIVTSCIVKSKQDRLNDLTQKNEEIQNKIDDELNDNDETLKIF
ncbi:MAG: hypothetical protein IJY90_03105 [Clostridia bacterium]|nr:hypothetical protein [Clostridia bacterium]